MTTTPVASPAMWQLRSSVRHYDWGHESIIPELMGLEADGRPWAELWMGAHPDEPSLLLIPEVHMSPERVEDAMRPLGE